MGFNFTIEPQNTCKNKGLRAIAKLCLNSPWGKFGQNPDIENVEYIHDWNQLQLFENDPKITTKTWHIISETAWR